MLICVCFLALQVLAEALAAARVLGRVLVPPRFICYCWQDSSAYTDMLSTCEMQGTDRRLPMYCSTSFFLDVSQPQLLQHLRYPNFLAHPQMQDALRSSSVAVQPVDGSSSLAAMQRVAAAAAGMPVLPLRSSQADIVSSLAAHTGKRIVSLRGLAPGWLTGLSDQSDVTFVTDLMYSLTATSGWCCLMTESTGAAVGQDMQHAFVGYQGPHLTTTAHLQQKLTSSSLYGSSSSSSDGSNDAAVADLLWKAADALFMRPDWCDESAGYLKPYNLQLARRPQHPCSYLAGIDYSWQLQQGLAGALAEVHQLRAGTAAAAGGAVAAS